MTYAREAGKRDHHVRTKRSLELCKIFAARAIHKTPDVRDDDLASRARTQDALLVAVRISRNRANLNAGERTDDLASRYSSSNVAHQIAELIFGKDGAVHVRWRRFDCDVD